MPKVRIIPTLLTDGVNLIKGECFDSWRTVGFVPGSAQVFAMRNVDELVVLDVSATQENRRISDSMVTSVAECLNIPLTVGGGIRTLADVECAMRHGADKVVIGSAVQDDPVFITSAAETFGSQAIVGSVDAVGDNGYRTSTRSGKRVHVEDVVELARRFEELGVGEILLQSTTRDGTLSGMDLESISRTSSAVSIPVIASGGAGNYSDVHQAVQAGASAVAAGAMFQFTQQTPAGARDYLSELGIPVRHG